MKKPMPMAIAFLSGRGMALKMAVRRPVSTRIVMTMPSITMMPMALRHGEAAGGHQAEGDHGVDAEARRQGVGAVGEQAHDERHDGGHEAGRGEHGGERQALGRQARDAGEAQDRRVHEDDVGHDHEGREAGQRVAPQRGAVGLELEEALEHSPARRREPG